jgi:uncharacterized protein (TIGR02271 family)
VSHSESPTNARSDVPEEGASFEDSMVRREEEMSTGTAARTAGSVRAHKTVDTFPIKQTVERSTEHADVERLAPAAEDSGEIETLPDGSVSIPIFEEELVVTKRMVVRERIVIRKSTVTDEHVVEAELKRERIEIDADPAVENVVHHPEPNEPEA